MKTYASQISTNNTPIKIISLLLGYSLWHIFGSPHSTTVQISVPLCFYNIPAGKVIKAPEQIAIQIVGKRSDIRSLDTEQLAVHINASLLKDGKNLLPITQETLFLPESIKLIHCSPINPIANLLALEG